MTRPARASRKVRLVLRCDFGPVRASQDRELRSRISRWCVARCVVTLADAEAEPEPEPDGARDAPDGPVVDRGPESMDETAVEIEPGPEGAAFAD